MHKEIRGFTLIELLVVIAIIGILANVVMARVNVGQTQARNSVAKTNVIEGGKGIEVFKSLNDERVISTTNSGNDSLQGTNGSMGQIFTGSINSSGPAYSYGTSITKTPSSSYIFNYAAPTSGTNSHSLTNGSYILSTNIVNDVSGSYYSYSEGATTTTVNDPALGSIALTNNSAATNPNCALLYTNHMVIADTSGNSIVGGFTNYSGSIAPGRYMLRTQGMLLPFYIYDLSTGANFPEIVTVSATTPLAVNYGCH
jgi:prepilin-type N-terminal cleavage/methylation domain-containing protein